ncbi:unnamed protein product, partial [Linum tenue]
LHITLALQNPIITYVKDIIFYAPFISRQQAALPFTSFKGHEICSLHLSLIYRSSPSLLLLQERQHSSLIAIKFVHPFLAT